MKKLTLEELKVQSFSTAELKARSVGGRDTFGKFDTNCNVCGSGYPIYCNTNMC